MDSESTGNHSRAVTPPRSPPSTTLPGPHTNQGLSWLGSSEVGWRRAGIGSSLYKRKRRLRTKQVIASDWVWSRRTSINTEFLAQRNSDVGSGTLAGRIHDVRRAAKLNENVYR